MTSKTSEEHKKSSNKKIKCGVITLSDSIKNPDEDASGSYIKEQLEQLYEVKDKVIITDNPQKLINSVNKMVNNEIDIIITTGGTGLTSKDITVETLEGIFEKKIDGFGELFREKSYEKIGSAALISRATAGTYNETVIFSMPGSPNAVRIGLELIIDELPHFAHHAKH